tara:strand:+ start:1254 stop:1853 length:600 start_codon:yes stop_codon:yes gene_type:complete
MPNWCNNNLNVSGPLEDIARFKATANGPTQSYNDYRTAHNSQWPIHDDVRLKALSQSLPEAGDIVPFSFHALFPVPEDFRRFPFDCNHARKIGEAVGEPRPYGGYRWEIDNWGCKWGSVESDLTCEEDTFLQYMFDTPWGPPVDFMHKVASDWPTLCFELEYEEPGMGFAGRSEWYSGELQSHDDWELTDEEEGEDDDE